MKNKVLYAELSYQLCGLCFNVHNELGRFRSERTYADALEKQLEIARVSFEREAAMPASFEGEKPRRNIPDFVIDGKIVIDAKAKRVITKEDYFQMKRYLEAGGYKLGLIVNFRQTFLTPKRVLNSNFPDPNS